LYSAAQLDEWIAVPVEELEARARVPFQLVETPADVHRVFAKDIWEEISSARAAGHEISLIVPLGPTGQYALLAERVNAERLALDHVSFFGMDAWLDWQGRPFDFDHPYSLEGEFQRRFLDLVDAELRPTPENVIFPSPRNLDRSAEELERRGDLVATFGGVGFQGHIAFNEPPGSRWVSVSVEELRASRTRILPVAVDTLIAHSQRLAGGNVFAVPPMAVTLGMHELLSAPRVRLYLDKGAWKRTILRILLFGEPDVDYPVTLVHGHPDVRVVADRDSATPPLTSAEAKNQRLLQAR
jgi:glucosamine-6-phosphate deaminase